MTTDVLRPPPPEPKWSLWCAVGLECAMVMTFLAHGSILGLVLCALYAWFSASWAALRGGFKD
jgi:hypothetical protein